MEQPKMYIQRKRDVCKLLKPLLYGLKQSGRQWYKKLDGYITNNRGKRSSADPCVYLFGEDNKRVIVLIYVDLILASNIKEHKRIGDEKI